tara:strand:- start:941 stop:1072 length:132 start_codon:yes stop_codon:yes gene_type:complete
MEDKLDQEARNLEIESLITACKRGLMSRLQLRKYLKEMGEIEE